MSAAALLTALVAAAGLAQPVPGRPREELRCGWYENPTPANAWLDDRDGRWMIGVQGGHQVEGDVPDVSRGGWVVTNGVSYGYGCACLRGVYDHRRRLMLTVTGGVGRTLRQCRADPRLPEPE